MKTSGCILLLCLVASFADSAQDDQKTKVKTKENGVQTTTVEKTDHDKMMGRETTKTTSRTTTQTTPNTVKKVEKGASKTGHAVKEGASDAGHGIKKGASKTAEEVKEHTPGTDAHKEHKMEKAD